MSQTASVWSRHFGKILCVVFVSYGIIVHFLWKGVIVRQESIQQYDYKNINPYLTPWNIFTFNQEADFIRYDEMLRLREEYQKINLDFPFSPPYSVLDQEQAQQQLQKGQELWPKIQKACADAKNIGWDIVLPSNYVQEETKWMENMEHVAQSISLHPRVLKIQEDAQLLHWAPTIQKNPYNLAQIAEMESQIATMKSLESQVQEVIAKAKQLNLNIWFSPPYTQKDIDTQISKIQEQEKLLQTHIDLLPEATRLLQRLERLQGVSLSLPSLITQKFVDRLNMLNERDDSFLKKLEQFRNTAASLNWNHSLQASLPKFDLTSQTIDYIEFLDQYRIFKIHFHNLEQQLQETNRHKKKVQSLAAKLHVTISPPYSTSTIFGLERLVQQQTKVSKEEFQQKIETFADISPYLEETKIPAGNFQMGCPEIQNGFFCRLSRTPQHYVTMSHSFMMMKTEVTVGMACALLPADSKPNNCSDASLPALLMFREALVLSNALSELHGLTPCYTYPDYDSSNIYAVPLSDCTGWRLPLETEWEYAARGGRNALLNIPTSHYLATEINGYLDLMTTFEQYAYLKNNSGGSLHPVRTLTPNPYDLYDMVGNAAEWCWDEEGSDIVSDNGLQNLTSVLIWGEHMIRGLHYYADTNDFSTELQAITYRFSNSGNGTNAVRLVRMLK